MNKIKILQEWINEANNIVFFGGAGVSTESGIKDFRSKDGLYKIKYKYPPEEILSHKFFVNNTSEFYDFYREKLNCINNEPNICHRYLLKLENKGKLKTIITQNIDGLHEKAGSNNILNLHGSIYKNYCTDCGKEISYNNVFYSVGIPRCTCGGIIKPDVVLYGEGLDDDVMNRAIDAISNCELLIVAGSSLTVYPASGFIHFFKGKHLVIINKEITDYDYKADLVINDKIGHVFNNLK